MPKVLNFRVIIEQDEDGVFVATVPAIPGYYTQGKTYEEAMKRVKEVVELCLEEAESDPAYKAQIDFSETEATNNRFLGVTIIPVKLQFDLR